MRKNKPITQYRLNLHWGGAVVLTSSLSTDAIWKCCLNLHWGGAVVLTRTLKELRELAANIVSISTGVERWC